MIVKHMILAALGQLVAALSKIVRQTTALVLLSRGQLTCPFATAIAAWAENHNLIQPLLGSSVRNHLLGEDWPEFCAGPESQLDAHHPWMPGNS